MRRRERYAGGFSSPGAGHAPAPAPAMQSLQQAVHGGEASAEPPPSPHARARELIAALKKQSAQNSQTNVGAMADGHGSATPRRMAAVKSVEEVKRLREAATRKHYILYN